MNPQRLEGAINDAFVAGIHWSSAQGWMGIARRLKSEGASRAALGDCVAEAREQRRLANDHIKAAILAVELSA